MGGYFARPRRRYPKGLKISGYCIYETGIRPWQRYFWYRFGNWTKARDTTDYDALPHLTSADYERLGNLPPVDDDRWLRVPII